MHLLGIELIFDCLEELSDEDCQRRLWLSDGLSGEVSSFAEAYERLFGDSGLGDALEKGVPQLPGELVRRLSSLRKNLDRVDDNRRPQEIIDDPAMIPVRADAAIILQLLKN